MCFPYDYLSKKKRKLKANLHSNIWFLYMWPWCRKCWWHWKLIYHLFSHFVKITDLERGRAYGHKWDKANSLWAWSDFTSSPTSHCTSFSQGGNEWTIHSSIYLNMAWLKLLGRNLMSQWASLRFTSSLVSGKEHVILHESTALPKYKLIRNSIWTEPLNRDKSYHFPTKIISFLNSTSYYFQPVVQVIITSLIVLYPDPPSL